MKVNFDANGMHICNICHFPIENKMIENGNEWGQDFAHTDCYWRKLCADKDHEILILKQKIYNMQIIIDNI